MIPRHVLVNENVRLVQTSPATTITIWHEDGTVMVNAAATNQFGSFPIRYHNFTPPLWGLYLISWDNAPIAQRWELLYASDWPLQVVEKSHELPDADVG